MTESEDFRELYRGHRWVTNTGELARAVLEVLDDLRARWRLWDPMTAGNSGNLTTKRSIYPKPSHADSTHYHGVRRNSGVAQESV